MTYFMYYIYKLSVLYLFKCGVVGVLARNLPIVKFFREHTHFSETLDRFQRLMLQYDCKESKGVFLWVLYKGGLFGGFSQRGIFETTPHRETDRQTGV